MKASGMRHTPAADADKRAATALAPPIVNAFSLVIGGPFHAALGRLRFVRQLPAIPERILVFVAVTWVPLVVLAAVNGAAAGHRVTVPLLRDFSVYGRFLVALPLLMIAEGVIDPWLRRTVVTLDQSGIIAAEDRAAYHRALERVVRLRDSALVELLLLLLAFFPVFLLAGEEWTRSGPTTWYRALAGGPTAAGWWFALVSSPLLRFVMLRWLWRALGVWGFLFYNLTRLRLYLTPAHPDRLGGLGFVLLAERRLGILFAALGSVIAGQYANWIAYLGKRITDLELSMVIFVAGSVLVVLCPLVFLFPHLATTRREGLIRYSKVGRELTKAFDAKWVARGRQRTCAAMLSDQDPSALVDYIGSYQAISHMRILPFNRDAVLVVAVQAGAPLAAVWALTTPLKEVVYGLLKMLF